MHRLWSRMTRKIDSKKSKRAAPSSVSRIISSTKRWFLRLLAVGMVGLFLVVGTGAFFNPPTTFYMLQEQRRLGTLAHDWVALDGVAPVVAKSVVAAEDANFCLHWGFDLNAIKSALAEGEGRGASTITQQVVKNVYLWQGRSWTRKALEAILTPMVEAMWSKRRIVEVYLNIAEFDDGVFGISAAAQRSFGITAEMLNADQAARLAAVLPAPKSRNASEPSAALKRRAAQIRDGAATIDADGRANCFQS